MRGERGPLPGAPELESAQETEAQHLLRTTPCLCLQEGTPTTRARPFHRQVVSHVLEDMQNPRGFPEGTLALEPEGSVFKSQFCLLPAV